MHTTYNIATNSDLTVRYFRHCMPPIAKTLDSVQIHLIELDKRRVVDLPRLLYIYIYASDHCNHCAWLFVFYGLIDSVIKLFYTLYNPVLN